MKKFFRLLLIATMVLFTLLGCNREDGKATKEEENTNEKAKEKVVVAWWGNQMLDSYTEYLCSLFPEVEFEFILATNSTDYYRFRQDHDDMPDISDRETLCP